MKKILTIILLIIVFNHTSSIVIWLVFIFSFFGILERHDSNEESPVTSVIDAISFLFSIVIIIVTFFKQIILPGIAAIITVIIPEIMWLIDILKVLGTLLLSFIIACALYGTLQYIITKFKRRFNRKKA